MTVQGLLGRLHAADVRLRRKGDDLLISGRRENVDAALLDGLRVHKAALLEMIGDAGDAWWSPPRIRPEAFPLAGLDEAELELILERVPGGASNVQDIYPLAPLQEGILFHHLMDTEKDTYLLEGLLRFDSRALLDAYVQAMRAVIARHDILRTSILWEGVREPVQVVWREAHLRVEEVEVDPAGGDAEAQLYARYHPRHYRLDLREAPIMRGFVAADPADGGWLLLLLRHHIVSDHTTMAVLRGEIQAHIEGRAHELPVPLPFRNYVAQARLGASRDEHAAFFRELLGDVDEPTAPYGLLELRGDWSEMRQAKLEVDDALALRIRERSRLLGVSAASLCHLAWALVLARVAGRDDVVFGTVLVGRMQGGEGTDRVMGPFINTLPIRVRDGAQGAEAAVRGMQAQLAGLMRHEHASLALAQRASRVQAPTPLFSALFNYRHSGRPAGGGGTEGMRLRRSEDRTNYPFNLAVDDFGDRLRLMAEVQAPADADAVCALMHRALEALVAALQADPGRAIGTLDIVPEPERRRVVEEFNDTAAPFPDGRCVHELFEAWAASAPDAPAVVFPGGALSYGELNRRANRLAHHLRALGVGPDTRVAIHVQRGPEMIVGVVAVLKAGGAYVPLDPAYPPQRLRYMLEDSAPAVVLTQESLAEQRDALLEGIVVPVVSLDAAPSSWDDEPETDPALDGLTPAHLAYVIYTSGSTGRPKGVMVPHRGVCNLVTVQARVLGATRESRVLQFASFSFDGCAFEIVMALGHGASLHLLPAGEVPVGEALTEVVESQGVTHALVPPPVLAALPEATTLPSLRTIVAVGDVLPPAVQARWGAGRRFLNGYGPTEATVSSTVFECGAAGAESPPIGAPVPNGRVYILDAAGRPAPVGVIGELHVGGVGIARGYLNRPSLTAERFVPDAFGAPGARLYRTGDLGRWLPSGQIEFAGRNDAQVKVRGFRIELGEIESRLAEAPGVREAVVVVRDDGGSRRLVAYVVGDEAPDAASLRAHLAERLPEYLVPAAFVRLDALPLTPNGKVDRRGLPAPDAGAWAAQAWEAPEGDTETALAEIWCEVLGIDRVGRRDNFFELGGHSLSAVTLVERMRRRGLHCEVRALFTTPTLAELAEAVGGESREVAVPPNRIPAGCRAITPEMLPLVELDEKEIGRVVAGVPGGAANVQDVYPLAPLQEGMLFHHLLTHERDPYVTRVLGSFDSRAALDAYLHALQQVIARHDILRTSIAWEGLREPVQVVWRQARLEVEEIEVDPAADAEEQLYARFDPRDQRVDVRRAPMLRAWVAFDAKRGRWLLLELRHHLSGDHTTLAVMKAEVRAILAGRGDSLAAPLPFRNYVAQARLGIPREEHEAFFRELLGDVREPTAPFGLLDAQGDGSGIERGRMEVEAGLAARLRERARALGVSAASVCHLAWARVLARTTGRDDVVFGTLLFGRMGGGAGADRVMGLFINTLPVRVRGGEGGVEAGVRAMHAQLAGLLRHEHAPLALAQRCSGVESPAPLFTSLLNYRHTGAARQARAAEQAAPADGMRTLRSQERTNYPVVMAVDDLGDFLGLTAHAPASLGPDRLCALMHRALEGVVDALETAPGRPVGEIDVLPAAERRALVRAWNATEADYPADACLHELFERQARRAPDAVALDFEGGTVAYGELNARANRLARHLRGMGVGPDTRVAIAAERSPEMVVGLLAVLKAGGAYVPLDPAYPLDRLGYMLEDSAPAVLLTQAALAERFGDEGVPCVVLDADPAPGSGQADTDLDRAAGPEHLAYVIYTSGSTGRPKGVMNLHRNVVNRLWWGQSQSPLGAGDAVLQGTSLSFDVATREIFWALLAGARLVLPAAQGQRDPAYLAATIRERGVTTLNLVPSLLQVLAEEPGLARCTGLSRIVCSGEALPAPLLARVRARMPWAEVTNIYGPSEAATAVAAVGCQPEGGSGIAAIGRPTANVRGYVLDGAGVPAPVGVAGELYLGGAGVARGYLNRPALTAERFVPDAFGGEPGARLYRTGDLARWRADGTLEFLGRNDQQVKVRGFRIETGEIEAQLAAHPAVREAAVVAREDVPGDVRLVAYVAGEVDFAALRKRLASRLPEYMVPAAYVRLDEMPKTPNGKLDRRALPAPGAGGDPAPGYEPPADETEEALAAIWAEVLGVARVGRGGHFFELGGHSLLAVKMVSRVRQELDVDIPLGDVFEHPTLAAFAQQVVDAELAQFDPEEIARLAALMQESGAN